MVAADIAVWNSRALFRRATPPGVLVVRSVARRAKLSGPCLIKTWNPDARILVRIPFSISDALPRDAGARVQNRDRLNYNGRTQS